MELLIGIDVGTTHLKAAAFTPAGSPVALAEVPTPAVSTPDGGTEYDPALLWEGVAQCLKQVAAKASGRIIGVGIASMAEAGVLLDEAGRPVYPATAWHDPRSRLQAAALGERPGTAVLYYHTGQFIMPKHGLAKLLWLKETHPDAYSRGRTWLSMAEWIGFCLTGERGSCPTLAARTSGYDLAQGRWAHDMLEAAGIGSDLFGPLVPEGAPLGKVSADAAAATGLPAGVAVTLAGHDHPCAALAVGLTGSSQLLDSTGTAEAVIGAVDRPVLTEAALRSQISQGPLPVPGLYGLQAGASAAGGSVEWLRRELLPDTEYAALTSLAESIGDGPSGLLYLPHLAGGGPPAVEPASRGALVGLTYSTTKAHVAKAVLEGTCYELRRMVSAMEELIGAAFSRIVVTGGHARNSLWLQLKADILGRPVSVPAVEQATLLGAALLAGVAGGLFADPAAAAAAAAISRQERLIAPRPAISAQYQKSYEVYQALFPALRPLYQAWPQ